MSTQLTVKKPPPTYTMGGTAGQFDLLMAIIAKTPVNYSNVPNTALFAVTNGVPAT